jgi:HEAT repeat protein
MQSPNHDLAWTATEDPDPVRRATCFAALARNGRMDANVVFAFHSGLYEEEEPSVKLAVQDALLNLASQDASKVTELRKQLVELHQNLTSTKTALSASLKTLDQTSIKSIVNGIRDSQPEARAHLLRTLGSLIAEKHTAFLGGTLSEEAKTLAVPVIVADLSNSNPIVREGAIEALLMLHGKIDVNESMLCTFSLDRNQRVKVRKLYLIYLSKCLPSITVTKCFENHLASDDNRLKRTIASTIGQWPRDEHTLSSNIIKLLIVAMTSDVNVLRIPYIRAFGELRIHGRPAVPALLAIYEQQPSIREEVLLALSHIGLEEQKTRDVFIDALRWPSLINTVRFAFPISGNLGLMDLNKVLSSSAEVQQRKGAVLVAAKFKEDCHSILTKAVNDESPEVRLAAATASGELGSVAADIAIVLLQDKDPSVFKAAVNALALVIPKDANTTEGVLKIKQGPYQKAVPYLIAAVDDPSLRFSALSSLSRLGAVAIDAVPRLVTVVADSNIGVVERCFAATTIGLTKTQSDAALVTLCSIVNDINQDQGLRKVAIQALGRIGNGSRDVVESLIFALKQHEFSLSYEAANSLSVFPSDAKVAYPDLVNAILVQDDIFLYESASKALIAAGPLATETVVQKLKTHYTETAVRLIRVLENTDPMQPSSRNELLHILSDPKYHINVRVDAVRVVGILRISPEQTVPLLSELVNLKSPKALRFACIQAIANFRKDGVKALDALLNEAESNEVTVRVESIFAIAAIIGDLEDTSYLKSLEKVLAEVEKWTPTLVESVYGKYSSESKSYQSSVFQPLFDKVGMLRELSRLRLAVGIVIFAGICISILLMVFYGLVAQLFRVLILRQQWMLIAGKCDYETYISKADSTTVKVRCARILDPSSSHSTALVTLQSDSIMMQNDLEQLRSSLLPSTAMLIISESSLFQYPWGKLAGGSWSAGNEAVITGQLCEIPIESAATSRTQRRLRVAAMGCRKPYTNDKALRNVVHEVKAVCARIRASKCGEHFESQSSDERSAYNCNRALFLDMLENADIVHIAAHATSSEILLHDEGVGGREIAQLSQMARCRILVLSCCDAASKNMIASDLIMECIRRGINVIAADDSIDDRVAFAFFDEFYGAFLSKYTETMPLAACIRLASQACLMRFSKVDEVKVCEDSLGAFMLYGNPSVKLELRGTLSRKNLKRS